MKFRSMRKLRSFSITWHPWNQLQTKLQWNSQREIKEISLIKSGKLRKLFSNFVNFMSICLSIPTDNVSDIQDFHSNHFLRSILTVSCFPTDFASSNTNRLRLSFVPHLNLLFWDEIRGKWALAWVCSLVKET